MKKAQITIFIIIAILIIAVVALFFALRGNINLPGKPVSPETAEIQNFVQTCLDDSLENVVFKVGENGGYYFPPKVSTPVLEVPYYIKDNNNLMPSKEDIEREISRGIERELFFCIGNFELFSPEYEITKGKMTPPEVVIEPERVLVELNYPLTIIKGGSKSKIEDFSSEVPVRLGIIYDAVVEFVAEDLKYPEGVCISCLFDISIKNGLRSSYLNYDDDIYIFIIEDPQSKLNNKEFVYVFANEH